MKRIRMLLFLLLTLGSIIGMPSRAAQPEKKIGVLFWNAAPRYVDAKNGIVDQLKKEGFAEPTVQFFIVNADGNKAKAVEAVHTFTVEKLDMIISLGTSATLAVTRDVKDVPVIFSTVFDPVASKIAKSWESSDNNTTGASNRVPLSMPLSRLKEFAPVKTLAVLYTANELNSVVQLKELQGLQADFQIRIIPVPLTAAEDVPQVLPEVMRGADGLYLSGSSVVDKAATTIVDMATKARVITITHIDDLLDKGVLLGVCADSYAVGRLTGEKAAMVLRGAKPSSIPIGHLEKLEMTINLRTMKAGGFQPSPSFMKSVTKSIE
jgi:putative ABC transport system substrate-binding protein